MSLITALTLAGFSTPAHAESPFINPVSLSDFSEWSLSDKTGQRWVYRNGWFCRSQTLYR